MNFYINTPNANQKNNNVKNKKLNFNPLGLYFGAQNKLQRTPVQDTFVKSKQISFKGDFKDIIPESLLNNPNVRIVNIFGDDDDTEDLNLNLLYDAINSAVKEVMFEKYVGVYLDALEQKIPDIKLLGITPKILAEGKNSNHYHGDAIAGLLEELGIKTSEDFVKVLQTYSRTKKNYPDTQHESLTFLKLYSILKDKGALECFPELFIENSKLFDSLGYDYDPNYYLPYLSALGIKSEKTFFSKFSHLEGNFNSLNKTNDRIIALNYVCESLAEKAEVLEDIVARNPETFKNLKYIDPLYKNYAKYIDYFHTKHNEDNWKQKLEKFLLQVYPQEKLSTNSKEALKDFIDTSSIKGELTLLEFIGSEDITINELNELASRDNFEGTQPIDLILNFDTLTKTIMEMKSVSREEAKKYCLKYIQILHAMSESPNHGYNTDGFSSLIKALDDFNINTEKSFFDFYLNLTKNQKASKKGKSNSKAKGTFTKEEIRDFVELLSFVTPEMKAKYQKDKNYPLLNKLQQRKDYFEKIKPKIEQVITSKKASHLLDGSFELFNQYENLLIRGKSIDSFIDEVIVKQIEAKAKNDASIKTYNEFFKHFKNVEQCDTFIFNNQIKINDDGNISPYAQACLKILELTLSDKDEKETAYLTQKFNQNNFIINSKGNLTTFLKDKDDEEIKLLFETILNKDIETLEEINKLTKVFADENKEYKEVLKHFNSQDKNLENYIATIQHIQKELCNLGPIVKIDNSNIGKINLSILGEHRNRTKDLIETANAVLSKKDSYNFLSGLDNTFSNKDTSTTHYQIAKEIQSGDLGYYETKFENISKALGMETPKEDTATLEEIAKSNDVKANFMRTFEKLNDEFVDFINSKDWLMWEEDMQNPPVVELHAKLRLIDRFILNENSNIENLYSEETKEKLKNIIRIIYTTKPTKLYKSDKNKDRFIAHFSQDGINIKGVFALSGELITVINENNG